MAKKNINTTINYSPNFDLKKRKFKQIKFLIFHYTGMKKEKDAITRLTSEKSKVSCHYFIKNNGEILLLVPDLYIAWHAGISSWKNYKNINKYSIGIEISNPGHDYKYKNFSSKQINSVLKLSKYLVHRYKINSKFVLGHSDIAPERKKDPGEKFPWSYLSKKKISISCNLNQKKLLQNRNIRVNDLEKKIFFKNLHKIGYQKKSMMENNNYSNILIKAFQRRFRQKLVNGKIDKECLIISNNISRRYK
tara:strand:- start:88 stop:834 length:747 start_codon:yes stop_codon:yes gene_type:complete